jgi:ORF6N domain
MKIDPLALQAERRILLIRRHRVMLDYDLAALYGVEARALNQAVKRNLTRFPADFMFQLTPAEADGIRRLVSQSVIPATGQPPNSSQTVMSSPKHRGRSYRPYAFTEQGVAMLSSVLRSPRAVHVNIAIMRAFVRLREMLLTNADLSRKLADLERKYDSQFKAVFDAIRQLMTPPAKPQREIGFHAKTP